MKIVNRRARFEYNIIDTFEVGILLFGHEVKSIKTGHLKLDASHVRILAGEAFLVNAAVPKYEYANIPDYNPTRTRKLLLHRHQLISLETKLKQGKLTLIPLACYTTERGIIKLEVGIGRAKQDRDKREELKDKAINRDIERALRGKETNGDD